MYLTLSPLHFSRLVLHLYIYSIHAFAKLVLLQTSIFTTDSDLSQEDLHFNQISTHLYSLCKISQLFTNSPFPKTFYSVLLPKTCLATFLFTMKLSSTMYHHMILELGKYQATTYTFVPSLKYVRHILILITIL